MQTETVQLTSEFFANPQVQVSVDCYERIYRTDAERIIKRLEYVAYFANADGLLPAETLVSMKCATGNGLTREEALCSLTVSFEGRMKLYGRPS